MWILCTHTAHDRFSMSMQRFSATTMAYTEQNCPQIEQPSIVDAEFSIFISFKSKPIDLNGFRILQTYWPTGNLPVPLSEGERAHMLVAAPHSVNQKTIIVYVQHAHYS